MKTDTPPQYAPRLTWRESLRRILSTCALYLPLLLLPLLLAQWSGSRFIQCHPYGRAIIVYGLFALTPLLWTLAAVCQILPFALAVIRSRQNPPPGHKTIFRTRIGRGFWAAAQGRLMLLAIIGLFAAAAVSALQAYRIEQQMQPWRQNTACQANDARPIPR